MSYVSELANKQYQTNTVIKIGNDWFSEYQVDSDTTDIIGTGSGILSTNIGIVNGARINPIQFDIKQINSTTQTLSFDLLDKDALVSNLIGASDTALLETPVKCYMGFITGSFDFQDYKLVSQVTVKKVTKKQNQYSFDCTEAVSLLEVPIYSVASSLNLSMTDSDTSLTLLDITGFPVSGMVKVDDEFMVYTGQAGNSLTGLSRGDLNSLPVAHDVDSVVQYVYPTGNINPVDLMLQLMVSPGGGGTYDVLADGCGIDQNLIDITTFEAIRDDNYATDQFRFYLYDIPNASKFIQAEILQALNTRLFVKDGKISGSKLDNIDLTGTPTIIDEDSITAFPSWAVSSDKVVNSIVINYAYSEGEKKYSRQYLATDDVSIATYGLKPTLTYNFKGIQADLGGLTIAQNRASRLLSRLATPQAEISVKTQFDKSNVNIGEVVNLVHRYLPQQGGGLGFNSQLEVLSRAVDFEKGSSDLKLAFTSYANLRIGLIAPANLMLTIVDQKTFTIDAGDISAWDIGYKVVLFNNLSNSFMPDAVNEIATILGNQITMVNNFTTTLTTDHMIRFADYDQCIDAQRNKYAFVGFNSGVFGDGLKSYQIVF